MENRTDAILYMCVDLCAVNLLMHRAVHAEQDFLLQETYRMLCQKSIL